MNTRRIVIGLLMVLVSGVLLSPAWAEVVGKTALPLDARQAKVAESTLGDVVADAARASVNADAAFILAGQLRGNQLPAGDLTQEVLGNALVFPDEQVVVIELKGSEVAAALERSLSLLPRPNTAFLQVSGMTVGYRPGDPAGQRVVEARVGAAPLVADRVYRMAMPLSLAKGAMGYYRIFGARAVKQTGPSLQDALVKYVQTAGTLSVTAGQRLHALTPSAPPQ